MSYFKSSLDSHLLDLLWNKYWVNTLSSNALVANRDYTAGQISDLAEKLEQAETQLANTGRMGFFMAAERKKEDSQLSKLTRDRCCDELHCSNISQQQGCLGAGDWHHDPVTQGSTVQLPPSTGFEAVNVVIVL